MVINPHLCGIVVVAAVVVDDDDIRFARGDDDDVPSSITSPEVAVVAVGVMRDDILPS